MSQAINASFCDGCGDYLEPSRTEIAWIAEGQARSVCPECKRLIYHERIEKAKDGLNFKKQRPELPLFALISG